MHSVVKWAQTLLKSCGVNTARFLKYVWPFYNIMHERVNRDIGKLEIFQKGGGLTRKGWRKNRGGVVTLKETMI